MSEYFYFSRKDEYVVVELGYCKAFLLENEVNDMIFALMHYRDQMRAEREGKLPTGKCASCVISRN